MRRTYVGWAIAAILTVANLMPDEAEARDGVVLFEHAGFDGRSREIAGDVADLGKLDFHDRASSMRVRGGTWLLCEHTNYGGRCVETDGDVSDFGRFALNDKVSSIRLVDKGDRARIVLFKDVGYSGRKTTLEHDIANLGAVDFNDKASSVHLKAGAWQLCEHANFEGRCVVVDGDVADLGALRLNDKVTSVRQVQRRRDRDGRRDERGYGDRDRGRIVLFKSNNFFGRTATLDRDMADLGGIDFSDNVSSVRVDGGAWLLCDDVGFAGRCVTVDSDVPLLSGLGLNNRISSIKRVR